MAPLAAFTDHGGRVAAARERFGGEDWIDLSTGIAPWAYPIEEVQLGLDRLPEPQAIAALEAAAAAAFGVEDPANVVAVPGTDLAMRLLAPVIGAARPAVVQPGYAGHRAAWPDATAVGGEAVGEMGTQTSFGEHDLLVLASPANPSGRTIDVATVRRLAATMTVMVDEAYADPEPCAKADGRLIVLRSFGKFYGLPGVRLGFVIAGSTIVVPLRTSLGDWPVSSAAVAIGTAAYRDGAWRHMQAKRIDTMARRVDDVLKQAGLPILGRAPLFRLVSTAGAARLFERLACRAILTRPFADDPNQLRIGLPGDDTQLDRLTSALEEADD